MPHFHLYKHPTFTSQAGQHQQNFIITVIKNSVLIALAASVAKVSAHAFVQGIVVDGTFYTGYLVTSYPPQSDPPASIGWTETATDLGFVTPDAFGSADIICHSSATNAQAIATVHAGGTVTMQWSTWPSSHHGPLMTYMASCHGYCTTVDKTTLEFFKIDQVGLISDTTEPGTWATEEMIANNFSWVIIIPSSIASGQYVLRHEILALQSGLNLNGTQSYPQCINLKVTSGGSDVPPGTLGESLYSETDPGISVDIYETGLTYTSPGPPLYTGGSGSGNATTATDSTPVAVETTAAAASTFANCSAVSATPHIVTSSLPTTFATSIKATTPVAQTQSTSPVPQPRLPLQLSSDRLATKPT